MAATDGRVMAVADDVAQETGARDVAAWLATETLSERGPNTADLRLAEAVDRSWHHLGVALADGRANLAQGRVIAGALEDLPDHLDPDLLVQAEEHLVALAADHRPRELAVLGRRILEVVAPDRAEAEEGRRLEEEELRARDRARLSMKRVGAGFTRISAQVPDHVADRLETHLDAFTSPRHHETDGAGGGTGEADRIPAARRRAHAFAVLLEAVIPAVLGGDGQVLDLGRAARLFSRAQRKAMRLRDRRCRAEGCTVPAGWCDAHHWRPWSVGGRTDLANGVLLCNWHHHRAHDRRYRADRLPSGDVRFARRR